MKIQVKDKHYVMINEKIQIDGDFVILSNKTLEKLLLNDFISMLNKDNLKAVICIEDGEEYKNLSTVEYVLNEMFKLNLSRNISLINFGGGVISDIGGFVAAIYKRGIKHINVATTLLAAVDAAVGGKNGVNNSFGKNLVGTFKQADSVYIFTKYFNTLKKDEISAALAESIKMALCFDKEFYNEIKNMSLDNLNYDLILEKSIKIKAQVVKNDEFEKGERMKLNYGHTFAHVIENLTNYKKYLHGQAVSIGMVMANKLSLKLGLIDKEYYEDILNTLKKFKLQTDFKISNSLEFYNAFFQDKKSDDRKINFILLNKEAATIKSDVKKEDVLCILKDYE